MTVPWANDLNCNGDFHEENNWRESFKFTTHYLVSASAVWEVPTPVLVFPTSNSRCFVAHKGTYKSLSLMNEIIHREITRAALSHGASVSHNHMD